MYKNRKGEWSRFPWRVFRRAAVIQSILVAISIAASGIAARFFFDQRFKAQVEDQLLDELTSQARDLPADISPLWCADHARGTALRFTVIAQGGAIVCDSHHDAQSMENHATRPEIIAAQKDGFGGSVRYSQTIGEDMLYGAVVIPERGLFLRAAMPLAQLRYALNVFDRSLAAFLLILTLGMSALSLWSARKLLFPMGRLLLKTEGLLRGSEPLPPLRDPANEDPYGEWSELESSFDSIRANLEAKTESLALERQQLATLMSSISDAILAVDTSESPLFFNTQFTLLAGFNGNHAARSRLGEFFRTPSLLEAFRRALREAEPATVSAIPIEVEGQGRRFVSLSVSPLKRRSGEVYGAVGIFHDVTDLKVAEQMRIDFVTNVSHELRTPLTSVRGYAETLMQDLAANRPVEPKFLEIITRNVDRLMELLNDLLDLSTLESRADVLRRETLDTETLSREIIQQLKPSFDAKQQAVRLSVTAKSVIADEKRLKQVLVNLLDNACKYAPVGGEITVSWEGASDGGTLLKVIDNGPGIHPDHYQRLFERFYRVDEARSRAMGGSGLGLAIVKHILQRHGGRVWVESRTSQTGTEFVCQFPSLNSVFASGV